jgi:hypothetical protein
LVLALFVAIFFKNEKFFCCFVFPLLGKSLLPWSGRWPQIAWAKDPIIIGKMAPLGQGFKMKESNIYAGGHFTVPHYRSVASEGDLGRHRGGSDPPDILFARQPKVTIEDATKSVINQALLKPA